MVHGRGWLRLALVGGVVSGLALGAAGCSGNGGSDGKAAAAKGGASVSTQKDGSRQGNPKADVTVSEAAIAVSPSGKDAHLTFVVTNKSKGKVSLKGASSNNFAISQLVKVQGGTSHPLPKGGIPLATGKSVRIDGSDYEVKLSVPIKSAKKGEKVLVQLNFDNGSAQTAQAVIDADVAKKS